MAQVTFIKSWRGNAAGKTCKLTDPESLLAAQHLADQGILKFDDAQSLASTTPAKGIEAGKKVRSVKAKKQQTTDAEKAQKAAAKRESDEADKARAEAAEAKEAATKADK